MSEIQSFLITGANSSLGQTLANYLSKDANNYLFLTSRTPHNFSELEKLNHVRYLPNIDLTKDEHLQQLASEVNKYFEKKFHIVNILGYFRGHEPFKNVSLAEAKRIIDCNFITLYGVASYLIPLMQQRGGGNFVAFSCHSVKYHYPHMAPFTAAKSAVESLIKSIANEYSKDNIIANSIALSTLLTENEKKLKPYGDHANWLKLEEVCKIITEIVKQPFYLLNGNTFDLFKYSDSFFSKSYFERIKR